MVCMGRWMVRKERATVASKRGWKKERVTGIWMLASRPRGPFHLPLSDYENPSPRKTARHPRHGRRNSLHNTPGDLRLGGDGHRHDGPRLYLSIHTT